VQYDKKAAPILAGKFLQRFYLLLKAFYCSAVGSPFLPAAVPGQILGGK
jgi:hypothetical protein